MMNATSSTHPSRWNIRLAWGMLAIFIGCAGVTLTNAQVLLWNNESGRCGTGASHLTEPRRSLLEDVRFDQPVLMTDFSMLFLWSSGGIDLGERVELTLWSDVGGQPGEPFQSMSLLAYQEVFTGEFQFGRMMNDIRQQVEALILDVGPTWIDMHMVGSENGFQMMTPVTGEPGWICYADFPPCPRPGEEVFGLVCDWSFKLFGFIPGEANEGFIRAIVPRLFSGQPQGGVDEVREADDGYYILTAGPGVRVSRPASASVIFETTLPSFPLDRMDLRVQSLGTQPGVRQEVTLFDYDARRWVVLDDQPLPFEGKDLIVLVEDLGNPSRFINDADGQARVRVEAYSTPVRLQPHQLKVNKVNFVLTYTP